jgi:hypothetical protein
VQCASTEEVYEIELKITARYPKPANITPETNGCLVVAGNIVPLYTTRIEGINSVLVPLPQWKYIAELVKRTINEILTKNIPLEPLELEETRTFSTLTNTDQSIGYYQVLNPGAIYEITYQTIYKEGSISYMDSADPTSFVTTNTARRDNGRSIGAVYENPNGGGYIPASIPLVLLEITISDIHEEMLGKQCDFQCFYKSWIGWQSYDISTEKDGGKDKFVPVINDTVDEIPLTRRFYMKAAQDVKLTITLYQPSFDIYSLMFSTILTYPIS